MRCQRCGFEIEPGQTFCSMCGTEQAKAIRAPKKKIKSIAGVIKVTSMEHAKMWGNLALSIGLIVFVRFFCEGLPVQIPYICLAFILLGYIFVQCLIPYKNPNASKSKKYKLGRRISFILVFIMLAIILLSGSYGLMDLVRSI